jgi:hypothetical protein
MTRAAILGALFLSLTACGPAQSTGPSEFTSVRDAGKLGDSGFGPSRMTFYRHASGRCFLYTVTGHSASMVQIDKEMCEVPR